MSRNGRDSERQVFSYMDDVPVKISEQFKPPRRVTLPVSYHRLPNDSVMLEYDFKLENSVLEHLGEWRRVRKTAAEERKERIKAQEKASAKLQDSAVPSTSESTVSPDPSPFPTLEPSDHPYPSSSDSIANISYPDPSPIFTHPPHCSSSQLTATLQNMSFSHPTSSATPQYSILTPIPIAQSSTHIVTNKVNTHFNFSDFEADTSSPFDNMELKTINDMEELAHVLQPLSNPINQIKQKPPDSKEVVQNTFSSPITVYSVDQLGHCNTFDTRHKKESAINPHINGLTGYNPYSTGPRVKPQDSGNDRFIPMATRPYDYNITSMPPKSQDSFSYYTDRTWSGGMNACHMSNNYTLDLTNRTSNIVTSEASALIPQPSIACSAVRQQSYATVQHPPLTYGASFPSTCNSDQDQHSPGQSLSKSVPDIVQELEKELRNKHVEDAVSSQGRSSYTPPPRPNSFGSTGLENWKPWPDLDSPPRGKTPPPSSSRPAVKVPPRSKLPNPFQDLTPSQQKLVKHISEMGFSLSRVARACQLLGEDDKKIVEFLLQVQCLEEKKYPGDRAEKALIVNRYSVDHAIKYLDALTQLLGLGFPEDRVSEALVMFNNDRDKALDKLIS